MPPEERKVSNPLEWLRRARSNLARAKADRGLPEILYEDLCFDAQQAAEKAIKAILVHRNVPFPKTHAIMDLLTLLHQAGVSVSDDVRQAAILTGYAVEARYPGISEEVTLQDYAVAIELAERVVLLAESQVGSKADSTGR
jgi:HEPN domain-containing protein